MKTLKFRTLWGVCEFLQLTGLESASLIKQDGVWELSYNANQLN